MKGNLYMEVLDEVECKVCGRNLAFGISYDFNGVVINICEDCSCALGTMHMATVSLDREKDVKINYIYNPDDGFREVDDEGNEIPRYVICNDAD